jgi:hypothetical protein
MVKCSISWLRVPGRIIKLVAAASSLSTQPSGVRVTTCWLVMITLSDISSKHFPVLSLFVTYHRFVTRLTRQVSTEAVLNDCMIKKHQQKHYSITSTCINKTDFLWCSITHIWCIQHFNAKTNLRFSSLLEHFINNCFFFLHEALLSLFFFSFFFQK